MQTVNLHFSDIIINETGKIDKNVVYVFTQGHCHSFALALHEMTGWPLAGLGGETNSPNHCVVYCPPLKTYVDIEGEKVEDRASVFDFEQDGMFEITPEDVPSFRYYLKADLELARPFAATLLKKLMKKHPELQANLKAKTASAN